MRQTDVHIKKQPYKIMPYLTVGEFFKRKWLTHTSHTYRGTDTKTDGKSDNQ